MFVCISYYRLRVIAGLIGFFLNYYTIRYFAPSTPFVRCCIVLPTFKHSVIDYDCILFFSVILVLLPFLLCYSWVHWITRLNSNLDCSRFLFCFAPTHCVLFQPDRWSRLLEHAVRYSALVRLRLFRCGLPILYLYCYLKRAQNTRVVTLPRIPYYGIILCYCVGLFSRCAVLIKPLVCVFYSVGFADFFFLPIYSYDSTVLLFTVCPSPPFVPTGWIDDYYLFFLLFLNCAFAFVCCWFDLHFLLLCLLIPSFIVIVCIFVRYCICIDHFLFCLCILLFLYNSAFPCCSGVLLFILHWLVCVLRIRLSVGQFSGCYVQFFWCHVLRFYIVVHMVYDVTWRLWFHFVDGCHSAFIILFATSHYRFAFRACVVLFFTLHTVHTFLVVYTFCCLFAFWHAVLTPVALLTHLLDALRFV